MDKVAMTLRYVIAGLGAGLVGFGVATADDVAGVSQHVEAILGGVAYLAAFGYALYNKVKALKAE